MRTLFVAVLMITICACEKSKAPGTAAGPVAPKKVKEDPARTAEVEFFGTWVAGEVKAAKYLFVAQAETCVPVPEKPTRYGETKLAAPGQLFAEFFIPKGTRGYACVYGLDESGKVVSVAGSAQNPMTFEGDGEVVKSKLEFSLKAP